MVVIFIRGGLALIYWLQKEVAEESEWETVWLKGLALELESESSGKHCVSSLSSLMNVNFRIRRLGCTGIQKPFQLTPDLSDRLLITRLEIDSEAMSCVSYLPKLPRC